MYKLLKVGPLAIMVGINKRHGLAVTMLVSLALGKFYTSFYLVY